MAKENKGVCSPASALEKKQMVSKEESFLTYSRA
jgi:hypothetical protein